MNRRSVMEPANYAKIFTIKPSLIFSLKPIWWNCINETSLRWETKGDGTAKICVNDQLISLIEFTHHRFCVRLCWTIRCCCSRYKNVEFYESLDTVNALQWIFVTWKWWNVVQCPESDDDISDTSISVNDTV